MRYVFFDTSVLVKAYVPEPGSDRVRDVLRSARVDPPSARVLACRIAYPEALSAVTRRENIGELSASRADFIARQIRRDFTSEPAPYLLADATAAVLEHAGELVRAHGLRGFDAVHLATALGLRPAVAEGDEFSFATADARLANAATAEGFELFEPAAFGLT